MRPSASQASFVLVDPLDGTKEFLAGRDEYTVNIGIVTNGMPVAGVIAAPAQGLIWRGAVGGKAERLRMQFSDQPRRAPSDRHTATRAAERELTAAISRTHLDPQSGRLSVAVAGSAKRYGCGSALKFCRLAQGDADIYPRLAPTCEWDIAAGHAILAAAGGTVPTPDGGELRFGKRREKFRVPGFIAWGDPALAGAAIALSSGSAR